MFHTFDHTVHFTLLKLLTLLVCSRGMKIQFQLHTAEPVAITQRQIYDQSITYTNFAQSDLTLFNFSLEHISLIYSHCKLLHIQKAHLHFLDSSCSSSLDWQTAHQQQQKYSISIDCQPINSHDNVRRFKVKCWTQFCYTTYVNLGRTTLIGHGRG